MSDQPVSVQFTEEMKGYVTLGETGYQAGYDAGKAAGTHCMFHLTIVIPDVDFFVRDPEERGTAAGYLECAALGEGRLPVSEGWFNLFVDTGQPDRVVKTMRYRLFFADGGGRPRTLVGHKVVEDDGVSEIWHDTTTLYTRILEGHVAAGDDEAATVAAAGILHIKPWDFARQLTTFRSDGATFAERTEALAKFGKLFLGTLWEVYGPHLQPAGAGTWNRREIPLYTLEGVRDAEVSTHYLTTGDKIGLSLLRFQRAAADDVVVLLHGLTTSTDMFVMPEQRNLVNYLLDHGYPDVFSFDWRGSMRHNYNLFPSLFNLDDIALYDHPAAFDLVRRLIGEGRRIHVVCHCVGSITFMMSLFAGLVGEVASVVSNSVSLTPKVPRWSAVKLAFAPFLVSWILRFPNLNPRWGYLPGPGIPQGKPLSKIVDLFHPECDVPACHMVSFMWGAGRPAAYEHANLLEATHNRLGDLFGAIDMHYYIHIRKMVQRGVAVKMSPEDPRYDRLPNDYLDRAAGVTVPILFMTGDHNRVFEDSNVVAYQTLKRLQPEDRNELRILPGYGHQDPFMGKDNHQDVFPHIVEFLDRHRG